MLKKISTATSLVTCIAITGCASVAGNSSQPVSVSTIVDNKEVTGIGCTLMNDAGKWFVTTPASVTIHKSTGDLAIDCSKEMNLVGHETIVSKSNGAVWGNILLGGGIGYLVDRNTGAGFDYPNNVVIPLHKIDKDAGSATPALGMATAAPEFK
jgi:hypothetical protein